MNSMGETPYIKSSQSTWKAPLPQQCEEWRAWSKHTDAAGEGSTGRHHQTTEPGSLPGGQERFWSVEPCRGVCCGLEAARGA